jgi:hypothetical protein
LQNIIETCDSRRKARIAVLFSHCSTFQLKRKNVPTASASD